MPLNPADRSIIRLESRRYATKCEGQIAMIHRADTLREVTRLAVLPLPYSLSGDFAARDGQNLIRMAAEDRARELIAGQIENFIRAEPANRDKFKRMAVESWANLTGPMAHLHTWANSKMMAAEQAVKI